jgi:tRNA(Ile)-lysidine synthase
MNLQRQIEDFIDAHCQPVTTVIIGLSGGIDSVVLLDLLANSSMANAQLRAIHVHHGLSALADEWVSFCQALCARYDIDFRVEYVELATARNIEAGARDARYQALATHVGANDILVTAQHGDDQAETILLALKRGSGVQGLASMPVSLPFALGRHNRPLLMVSKKSIESYAQLQQLHWVEDDSNLDCRFDRNYLRNEILPQLNRRWQGFSENLARSANLLGQSLELLDELAALDYEKVRAVDNKFIVNALSISKVRQLSLARQNNLIRYWLRLHRVVMPSQAQLHQVSTQILTEASDNDPIVSLAGIQIRRYQGVMTMVEPLADLSQQVRLWQGQELLTLPNRLGRLKFNDQDLGQSLTRVVLVAPGSLQVEVRFYVTGSYKAWPVGRDRRRAVKKLWQEFGVPTWLRSQIPLIFFGDRLVAALGVWVEQGFAGDIEQSPLVISWHRKNGSCHHQ